MDKARSRIRWIYAVLLHMVVTACSSTTTPGSQPPAAGMGARVLRTASGECIPPMTQHEDVVVSLEREEPMWKLGYSVENPGIQALTEFIREGDDIGNWRELFTIQSFPAKSWVFASPEQSLDFIKSSRERRCPGATQWNIIEKRSGSILFEWQAEACQGWPAQHEVGRIMYGKYKRFSIRYTAKIYQMTSDTRSAWIGRLSESRIVLRCR